MRRMSSLTQSLLAFTRALRRRRRSLLVEPLEDRTLLTAYVVDTLSDSTATDGLISLREAVNAAGTNAIVGDAPAGTVGEDTITFAPGLAGGTITLGGAQLPLQGVISITGLGWDQLTVNANNLSRVFLIASGANVSISGLSIIGGNSDFGGGIENDAGTLLLNDVYVHGNNATQRGGGVDTFDGTTTILNSTIANNTAVDFGGGINGENSTVKIINSTVSGNSATGNGGGISQVVNGAFTITNSTVTGNRADSDGNNTGGGGGIYSGNASKVTLNNTIVAGNFRGTGTTPIDVGGAILVASSAYNIIGNAGSAGGLTDGTNHNIVGNSGTGTRDINTILNTTLQNSNGAMVHTIVIAGPADDGGSNALSVDQTGARLLFDQRGGPFVRVMAGTVDIGAYEIIHLGVNTLQDETTNPDTVSLREALAMANAFPGLDNVFDLPAGTINLTQGQLVITDDLLLSGPGADQLTINAQGNSRVFHIIGNTVELVGMTIRGGNALLSPSPAGAGFTGLGGGILNEKGTLTVRESVVTLNSATYGGGINNYGTGGTATLHLIDSTVSNNTVTGNAGGLYNWGDGGTAVMKVTQSTVAGNHAGIAGGGFFNWTSGATLYMLNSTVSSNTVNIEGAGLFVQEGTVTSVNSTIVLNRGDADGNGGSGDVGGIDQTGAVSITLHNTIIAGNLRGLGTTASDLEGTIQAASSNNLIGDASTAGGLTNGTNGNIVGVNGSGVRDINTILDTTLKNNGGPTPTHALVFGSPAVDAGDESFATDDGTPTGNPLLFDQRGFNRIDNIVDIGATEGVADDFGNDTATAFFIKPGKINGTIESLFDTDFFSFQATKGVQYTISVNLGSMTDSFLALYKPDGSLLTFNDNRSESDFSSQLIWTAPTTGLYFLEVSPTDLNPGTYELDLFAKFDDVATFDPVTGQWRYGISNGTEFTNQLGPLWNPAAGWHTFTGDFNGDGFTDLSGWDDAGNWQVAFNNGLGGFTTTNWGNWGSLATSGWTNVHIADFSGDGQADVVGLNNSNQWIVGVSNGSTAFTFSQWGTLGAGYIGHVVGDFNGDAKADIANLHSSGAWWVHESNGTMLQLDHYGTVAPDSERHWRNLMKGDFNGDNVDDVLFQDNLGNWFLGDGRANADGKFTVHYANRWDPNAFVEFFIGDFDGDGYDDMLGRSTGNVFWVNRSLATTTKRMHAQFWGNAGAANTIASAVGDFNGDHIADLATVRQGSGVWIVWTGTPTNKFVVDGFLPWNNWNGGRVYGGQLN